MQEFKVSSLVSWLILATLAAKPAQAGGASPPGSQPLSSPALQPPVSNPDDCFALLEFKASITNWNDFQETNGLQGWCDTSSCCGWDFVNCSSSGSVTTLILDGSNMPLTPMGSISPHLVDLGSLQILSIQNTNLTGQLPRLSKPGSFNNLQQLILSGNAITGTLPTSWGQAPVLQSLQILDLHDNLLTGSLPSCWGKPAFGSLKELNLAMNHLSGSLPNQWSLGFPGLETLFLQSNELEGCLPAAWTNGFWALQQLDLSDNRLVGSLPNEWGDESALSSLWAVRLSGNLFQGTCPEAWASWSTLGELDLSGNDLTGSLPATWGSSRMSLFSLSLAHNSLEGSFPSSWSASGMWGALQVLDVSSNQLTGPLPSSWASVQNFQTLVSADFSNNSFNGTLPVSWGALQGALPKLASISLAANQLTGNLPEAWRGPGMPALNALDLSQNAITGILPISWGSIDSFDYLRQLYLDDNQLTGSLPPEYGQRGSFPLLRTLQLANNRFSGSVPASWGGLLASVWLKPGNDLCGPLSPQMLACEELDSCRPSISTTCTCSLPIHPNPACTGVASTVAVPEEDFPVDVAITLQLSPMDAQNFTNPLQNHFLHTVLSVLPAQSSLLLLTIQDTLQSGDSSARRRSLLASSRQLLQQAQRPGSSIAPALSPSADKGYARDANITKAVNVTFAITSPNSTMSVQACRDILNATESGHLLQALQKVGLNSLESVILLSSQAFTSPSQQPPLPPAEPVYSIGPSAASTPYPTISKQRSNVSTELVVTIVVVPVTVAICAICLCSLVYRRRRQRKLGLLDSKGSVGSTDSDFSGRSSLDQRVAWLTAVAREPSLISFTNGVDTRLSGSDVELPWSDWEARPEEFQVMRRKDGTLWELGRGNFGVVYKGLRNDVTPVAIKVMSRGGASLVGLTPEQKARQLEEFKREILILKACRDKNIVTFLGASLQDGATMLVTEFCEGGDLYHALQADDKADSRRFCWYRANAHGERAVGGLAKRIALDVARGLAFLHSRGVVHMDLKSANILLAAGTAKLADVGLCKVLRKEVISTMSGCRGTFSHAAPEVLLGRQCNELVDIYSYGVILWELSTLESPTNRMLRPIRVPEECPKEIALLIDRCLSEDPRHRPSAVQCVQYIDKVR